ncbi:MAG: nicotinate (nicotinamide) nucleotide adenylyltransferase [Clostridia bacterium]|nr:nicotinate (nicotinamide) nucleotide adenylyltransferase [Clostridia bacterium]
MDRVVAVFGGTFNPIHNGHVEMAKKALALPQVEKLVVIPTYRPPHKDAQMLATGEDRLNMCRIALIGIGDVEFSDIELARGGLSYTYDTLCELGKLYGKRAALMCGGDMITTFSGWYRYRDILKMADIIAFRRIGVDNAEFDASVEKLRSEGGNITVIEADIADISSTEVRAGEWDKIPSKVLDYIKEKGLYGVK